MSVEPFPDPGSPRALFGAEMRRLREAAQLSQAAVAARLGCTQTQVSRLEAATRTPSKSDAERLDRLFASAGGTHFANLYRRITVRPGGPIWFKGWTDEIEPNALVLRSWDPLLIPGLFQTESYARHIFAQEPQMAPERAEELVEARMRRRRVLDRATPPIVHVLIDAGVLRRKVGDPDVMREQLEYLLSASTIPHVSIQVVDPECLPGMAGPFMIAELPHGQPHTVHADSPVEGQITVAPDYVNSVQRRYEAIRLWAYPERISQRMIEDVKNEWI
ncbi:transcriptional regulator [Sphaerisporangium siamense]|uniref:Transcriptional regulator with XRE-family HTH domain n=1 Tax=Sphaerisporangium siamense TaxID=795645 RepID=A0A7W7GD64_9ACTN|nr:helix-turn-helix transcriptional regulator [Sphaerisporangium siamense]MBB4704635.1 transcriptional regulator with XRE-family HTH domain [Sphaerisporangium siamense]GII86249.1 transcriptional regulator [Sphaerisporangium siamense]